MQFSRQHHFLPYAQICIDICFFRHDTYVRAGKRRLWLGVVACDPRRPAFWDIAGQHANGRAFCRRHSAEKSEYLTTFNRKGNLIYGDEITVLSSPVARASTIGFME